MAVISNSRDIFVDETERKPNRYAANVLAGVVAVIAVVCLFNELGIFALDKSLVRICFVATASLLVFTQIVVHNKKWLVHPSSKYIIMSMVLVLVLMLTVLLNIHAVLAFVLPILLATQYRSRAISWIALAGSCLCCIAAPIFSYLFDTWSLLFLTGYVQTFCRVTLTAVPGNGMTMFQDLWQIFLYWSLPQMLTLCVFGLFLYSATKNGIASVTNQMQVLDLSHDLNRQLESNLSMQEKMLFAMSDIIENRDVETGGHVRRTSEIIRLMMSAMLSDPQSGVTDAFCSNVIKSAPMHDLGKIAIPDTILRKPGSLTADEYETVKQHPVKSALIISQALTGIEDEELLVTAKNIAKYHHERIDGTGYPEHLRGDDIPLEARIMAIADVYDALVSERCYKAPMAFDEAFDTIEACMGTQFDPALNRYFIACRQDIEAFYIN